MKRISFIIFSACVTLCIPNILYSQAIKGDSLLFGNARSRSENQPNFDTIQAQRLLNARNYSWFISLSYLNANPQGTFRENLRQTTNDSSTRVGRGFSIEGCYQIPETPLSVGGIWDMMFMGEDKNISSYFPTRHPINLPLYIPVRDTLQSSNTAFAILPIFKIQPNIGNVFFPFIEGGAGLVVFHSSVERTSNAYQTENFGSNTNAAFGYTIGAGFRLKFAETQTLPDTKFGFAFDAKARLMSTNQTDITFRRVNTTNGEVTEIPFTSRLDFVQVNIGFSVLF